MNAILLAAGYGTRLGSIVNNVPKCLLPINKKPLLQIWLEKLEKLGVNKVLINTHYLSHKVDQFVKSYSTKIKIKIVNEKKLLGTAATLKKNANFFENQDGLLIHADNFVVDDLEDFFNFHNTKPKDLLLTMFSFKTDNPSSCGILKVNHSKILVDYFEKSTVDNGCMANGAIFILDKQFFKSPNILQDSDHDFCRDVIPRLLNQIYVYETDRPFIDIGTPGNYKKAQNITL